MNKDEFIAGIRSRQAPWGPYIQPLAERYLGILQKLQASSGQRDAFMVKVLDGWLEDSGFAVITDALDALPDTCVDPVKAFAACYGNLFDEAEKDAGNDATIDLMFAMPGQFAKDMAVYAPEKEGYI